MHEPGTGPNPPPFVGSRRWVLAVLGCLALCPDGAVADPGVVVARASRLEFPLQVEGLGTTVANESVEIRAQITETVSAIEFEEGEEVGAGKVLVRLKDADALAAVAAAKARLAESEAQHDRARRLAQSNLLSESELETLLARRDADRAALDAAEVRLAETVIRAPFAGKTGLRRISIGSLVGPSTVITTLDDTDPIKIDFEVPETALSRLARGLPVEARSAAWIDSVFLGKVVSIDSRVDPVSRTVTVRAEIPNRKGLLRPGMFLTVKILREDVTALLVPEESIVPEQSRQYVLIVGEDRIVEKRLVVTGRRRPGLVEIVNGLNEGELVIVEGTQIARPGNPAEILRRIEFAP